MIKCCANQFPDESRLKNKVWELYLLYPFSLASRIAYGTDKTIATHTNRQYLNLWFEVGIYL